MNLFTSKKYAKISYFTMTNRNTCYLSTYVLGCSTLFTADFAGRWHSPTAACCECSFECYDSLIDDAGNSSSSCPNSCSTSELFSPSTGNFRTNSNATTSKLQCATTCYTISNCASRRELAFYGRSIRSENPFWYVLVLGEPYL